MSHETFSAIGAFSIMFVMVVPPLLMARWYFRELRKSEGGKKLEREQNKIRPNLAARERLKMPGGYAAHRAGYKVVDVEATRKLHQRIMAGEFGLAALSLQKRVYVYTGLWVLSVAVLFTAFFVINEIYFPRPSPPADLG